MIEREFSHGVALRRIPYPYQAMLAICSDLDETPDTETYLETMRYLNTNEETKIGQGVGLEVGNTIYFDMPSDQFSYWNTDDEGRKQVRTLIKSGHIDCLHSYGDLATTRKHVERNLAELARYNCMLEVWIDHGVAPSNFDRGIMRGNGDTPGSPIYHSDLTCGHGIKYVWRGRVTSITGQDRPRNLADIGTITHPFSSAKTILKEFAKGLLARYGNEKYAMHAENNVLRRANLRDGRNVLEFMRCNPYWGGVGLSATAEGIAEVLNKAVLQKLVDRQGACVLYTHLGKIGNNPNIFNENTQQAFSLLSQFMKERKILVTTTRRLLGYCQMKQDIAVSIVVIDGSQHLEIVHKGPDKDLEGLTICIPDTNNIKVFVNNTEIMGFQRNPHNRKGQASISLPWRKLEFPQISFNHALAPDFPHD